MSRPPDKELSTPDTCCSCGELFMRPLDRNKRLVNWRSRMVSWFYHVFCSEDCRAVWESEATLKGLAWGRVDADGSYWEGKRTAPNQSSLTGKYS